MKKKQKDHCGKFFDEYDEIFLLQKGVPAADKAKVKKAVGDTAKFLEERAQARADGNPVPKANAAQTADAKLLAEMQLKLFKKYFGQNLDYDGIQTCFVLFANGELRTGQIDPERGAVREPNGSYFFLFAEFALLAVELGIDAAAWTELARVMVKAQEVFLEAYPPRGGTGLFRPRRFKKGKQVDDETKKKLHDKYKDKTLQEIIDCHNKNLKKAAAQPNVAYIPPTREEYFVARLENRVFALLDKAKTVADQQPQTSPLLYQVLADVRAVFQGELGRTAYFNAPEGGTGISGPVGDGNAIARLAGQGTLRVDLASIKVESKGIGKDFVFDYQVGDQQVRFARDMASRTEPYEVGARIFSRQMPIQSSGPVSIPVTIRVTEEDPKFSDQGVISGNLQINPDQGRGLALITGSMEAQRAESGFARFEFSFEWELD